MAVVKDLGVVTAYAYAVAGGYVGTEAEFTEALGRAGITLEQLENLTAVATTLSEGSEATASYSDGVLTFGIPRGNTGATGPQGPQGNKGDTGNGIVSIAKTGTSGLVDTYTITFTDGTTTTFTVTNGADGDITNVAQAFDATKAYAVGDMVLYQGTLYAFTAAHAAGAWVGTDAQAVILADEVTELKDDLTNVDNTINGEVITITYRQTGSGYIGGTDDNITINYTPNGTGNNQMMVINDLSTYGIAIGSKMKVTVGWATGYVYAVAFASNAITGVSGAIGFIKYSDESNPQTLEFIVPQGTAAIAIFNRGTVYATPTIQILESGLVDDVQKLKSDLNEKIKAVQYMTCVKKPFDFSGKRLQFFGDSLTYGYIVASGSTPAHQATNQYPKLFSEQVGAGTYVNYGVSGSTLAVVTGYNSIYTEIQQATLNGDYVFVAGGVNDWQLGVNAATLETAVENICTYLSNNFSGEVIWITPIYEAGRVPINPPTQTLQNVRNVITRIALKYGYSVVQGWEFPFPTEYDDSDYIELMFQDKIHPTELGYAMYAQALRNAVC